MSEAAAASNGGEVEAVAASNGGDAEGPTQRGVTAPSHEGVGSQRPAITIGWYFPSLPDPSFSRGEKVAVTPPAWKSALGPLERWALF